jgi:hypothetical protein
VNKDGLHLELATSNYYRNSEYVDFVLKFFKELQLGAYSSRIMENKDLEGGGLSLMQDAICSFDGRM